MHDIIIDYMQHDGIDSTDDIIVDCAAYDMLPALAGRTANDDSISAGELADLLADDFNARFAFWFGDLFGTDIDEDTLRSEVEPVHVQTCTGAFLHGWTETADDIEARLQAASAREHERQLELWAEEEGDDNA